MKGITSKRFINITDKAQIQNEKVYLIKNEGSLAEITDDTGNGQNTISISYIESSIKRKRYASNLVREIITEAEKGNYDAVLVNAENKPSEILFRKLGFKQIERESSIYIKKISH